MSDFRAHRYSLKTGILFIAAISICLGSFHIFKTIKQLQSKNTRLEQRLGFIDLSTGTTSDCLVRKLETASPLTWNYRVYFPEGQRQICFGKTTDAGSTVNVISSESFFATGEFTLAFSLFEDRTSNWWINCHVIDWGGAGKPLRLGTTFEGQNFRWKIEEGIMELRPHELWSVNIYRERVLSDSRFHSKTEKRNMSDKILFWLYPETTPNASDPKLAIWIENSEK